MTPNPPLSNLQMSLLKLYTSHVSDENLMAINQRIVDYFAEKVTRAADTVWDEKGYSDDLMQQWLEGDFRKGKPE